MTSNEMKPSEALRVVRRASSGGYFDDLASVGDFREEIRQRVTDLVGEAYADRVGFYRRGSTSGKGNFFVFWLRQSWIVEDIQKSRRTA